MADMDKMQSAIGHGITLLCSWFRDGNLAHGHSQTGYRMFLIPSEKGYFKTNKEANAYKTKFREFIKYCLNRYMYSCTDETSKFVFKTVDNNPEEYYHYKYNSFGPCFSRNHIYITVEEMEAKLNEWWDSWDGRDELQRLDSAKRDRKATKQRKAAAIASGITGDRRRRNIRQQERSGSYGIV